LHDVQEAGGETKLNFTLYLTLVTLLAHQTALNDTTPLPPYLENITIPNTPDSNEQKEIYEIINASSQP